MASPWRNSDFIKELDMWLLGASSMKPISLAQIALMKTKRGLREASQPVSKPLLPTPHHLMRIVQLRSSTPRSEHRKAATGCQAPNTLVRGVNLALQA